MSPRRPTGGGWPAWLAAGALATAAGAGCTDEKLAPAAETPSEAQPLGMFDPSVPGDMREQAYAALVRDAYRRENRYVDAVRPGHLLAATRVTAGELERGAWTPAQIYQLGAQLFDHRFHPREGFGGADTPAFSRFHRGARGGPDAYRCASCHRRGGPAGGGDSSDNTYLDGDGDSQATTLERNPPALVGAGLVEIAAREMSEDMAAIAAALRAQAAQTGAAARGELLTKGVRFGHLTVRPDGSHDVSEVEGVDTDLVVKPFGRKGTTATLREMVEDELGVHLGMQTSHLAAHGPPERVGPFPAPDPDGDGVVDEITEGQLGALTLFLAMQEVPQIELPELNLYKTLWLRGRADFDDLGCSGCHVVKLPLRSTEYVLPSRTGGPPTRIDLAEHGGEPRIARSVETGAYEIYLYSDLKRHVVGPNLREARSYRRVPSAQFLTPPLWGLVRSRPYLHHGHAPTVEAAVLAHSGEAQGARNAYAAIEADLDRAPLRVFLASLTRARRMSAP